MQLNGINIQPKIGSDFAAQYGAEPNSVKSTTLPNTSYDNNKVTQNDGTAKTPNGEVPKYAVIQPDAMIGAQTRGAELKYYHGISAKAKMD